MSTPQLAADIAKPSFLSFESCQPVGSGYPETPQCSESVYRRASLRRSGIHSAVNQERQEVADQ